MSDKPLARILREKEFAEDVARKAIALRRIGKACDEHEESLRKLWDENPEMPRSLTFSVQFDQAFKEAMAAFDDAVQRAMDAGIDFTFPSPEDTP